MSDTLLDLRGLKCPLPALRTRRALREASAGTIVTVLSTDPLAGIDIPHVVRETGHLLEGRSQEGPVARFRIRTVG